MRSPAETTANDGTFHRPAVERVIAAMREETDGPRSLRDMADVAHLSPFHFARVFKGVTGVPPGEFLAALRLERAKRLLLTTDAGVGDICFEVGYESLGTFTSRFTRLVGIAPGKLRRLPEKLAAFEGPPGPASPGAGLPFRVAGACGDGDMIFAGLFPGAIPQGRPVSGALLTAPGVHRLPRPPDGRYTLMAAALPASEDLQGLLLPGAGLRVGRAGEPVLVRDGRTGGCPDVELRPPLPTDPPLLVSLPALLLERSGAERGG
jgi:AraC family transcriptional regulator